MNLLCVTENYSLGGLETFLKIFLNELENRGWTTFLAVGRTVPRATFPCNENHVFMNFGFAQAARETTSDFVADVHRLQQIIRDKKIDVVFAQPFYSFFAATIAAKMENVLLAYVIHSTLCLTFPSNFTEYALFNCCLHESTDCIFSVQHLLIRELNFNNDKTFTLRNPVSKKSLPSPPLPFPTPASQKRWALASRLDEDKLGGIKSFLAWMPYLQIDILDIFGTGSTEEELKSYASKLGISKKLVWHGFEARWLDYVISHDYGVIGLDRVAIEALCCDLPVILLTQDNLPCGLVDNDIFYRELEENFATHHLETLHSASELNIQLAKVYDDPRIFKFKDEALHYYSAEKVAETFCNAFKNAMPSRKVFWSDFIEALEALGDKETLFFSNPAVAKLMNTYISPFVLHSETKNSIFSAVNHAENTSQDEEIDLTKIEIIKLNNCIEELQKAIDDIQHSRSWRIGRVITALPRYIKKRVGKIN